jgi:hypothetical protein
MNETGGEVDDMMWSYNPNVTLHKFEDTESSLANEHPKINDQPYASTQQIQYENLLPISEYRSHSSSAIFP